MARERPGVNPYLDNFNTQLPKDSDPARKPRSKHFDFASSSPAAAGNICTVGPVGALQFRKGAGEVGGGPLH